MKINISDKELNRAARNLFLDADKDDFISLENDEYFYKIYGKEFVDKLLKESSRKRIKNRIG